MGLLCLTVMLAPMMELKSYYYFLFCLVLSVFLSEWPTLASSTARALAYPLLLSLPEMFLPDPD